MRIKRSQLTILSLNISHPHNTITFLCPGTDCLVHHCLGRERACSHRVQTWYSQWPLYCTADTTQHHHTTSIGMLGGLKEMLILLLWLGGGVLKQNAYIANIKDQNSYSCENGF